MKENPELNPFKTLYFVNVAVAFLLLVLLAITPYQSSNQFVDITILGFKIFAFSSLALSYLIFFVAALALVIADFMINEPDNPAGELFDIATVDEGHHYLLQRMGLSLEQCVAVAVVLGLAYGLFLANNVYVQHKAFFFVPSFFSASPLQGISSATYDGLVSSYGVANVEELLFVGSMGMLLWSLARHIAARLGLHPLNWGVLIGTFLIVVLLNGYIAAFVFHAFVYGSKGYAFEDAQNYFSLSTAVAAGTGTIVGGIIAHSIHNYAVKTAKVQGSYQIFQGGLPSGFAFLPDNATGGGQYSVLIVPVEK